MTTSRRRYPLEIANAMYWFAFQTKRHQISKKYPHLTEQELHKETTAYFVPIFRDIETRLLEETLYELGGG